MQPEVMDSLLEDLKGQNRRMSALQREVVRASTSLPSPLTSSPRVLGTGKNKEEDTI